MWGGEAVIPIDVRLIVATNRHLPDLIERGEFREDLYYRLNVVGLQVPALRDRKEDIPLLTQHFISQFSEKNRKQVKGITPAGMDRLIHYHWPGNVRELMNTIERAVVLSRVNILDVDDLSLMTPVAEENGDGNSLPAETPVDVPLDEIEKIAILNTLESSGGNKSEAARRLGITRKTLHKKLKKYGMDQ